MPSKTPTTTKTDNAAIVDFAGLLRMLADTMAAHGGKVSRASRRTLGRRITRPGYLHPLYAASTQAHRDPDQKDMAIVSTDAIVAARLAMANPPQVTAETLRATADRLEALAGHDRRNDGTAAGPAGSGRLKKGEANQKVADFIKLADRPDLTLAMVHKGTGLAKSTISGTQIWKDYDVKAKAKRDENAAAMRKESERWEFDNER